MSERKCSKDFLFLRNIWSKNVIKKHAGGNLADDDAAAMVQMTAMSCYAYAAIAFVARISVTRCL